LIDDSLVHEQQGVNGNAIKINAPMQMGPGDPARRTDLGNLFAVSNHGSIFHVDFTQMCVQSD